MIRTVRNYEIKHETWDKAWEAKRYNRALTLTYRDKVGRHTVTLQAGESDEIHVFRELICDQWGVKVPHTYVLTINRRHGYCGVEIFAIDRIETGAFYSNADESLNEKRKTKWDDLTPINLLKKILDYIDF